MSTGVVKITQAVNPIADFQSFTIMGDPGCDGLGAEIMTTFAKGLTATQPDFAIILGDIVPIGQEHVYQLMSGFINTIAAYPVYMLCGNHDNQFYEPYFGLGNYILYNERTLFVVLDNSKRVFDERTLDFLRESLSTYSRANILLLFHIPPPNRLTHNSVSSAEWERVAAIYGPYREKIKYILCGHVHTYFEDKIDGIPLIVSAGAGARLEVVSEALDKTKAFHHVLRFTYDQNGALVFEHITLDGKFYNAELTNPGLRQRLSDAFVDKCESFVKYRLYAQDALEKGFSGTAKLLRAAAESEYFHARNHFNNLNGIDTLVKNLEAAAARETMQSTEKYPEYVAYTDQQQQGLARYSFFETLEAEKVHEQLLRESLAAAKKGDDIGEEKYFTCTSCGLTIQAGEAPKNCPVCGAPYDKIYEVV